MQRKTLTHLNSTLKRSVRINRISRSTRVLFQSPRLPRLCASTPPQLSITKLLLSSQSASHHLVYGLSYKQTFIDRTLIQLTNQRQAVSTHFRSLLPTITRQKAAAYTSTVFFFSSVYPNGLLLTSYEARNQPPVTSSMILLTYKSSSSA